MDYVIDSTLMSDIADAIREKNETTDPIVAADMPSKIREIKPKYIYGFHIDSTESDPTACITYIADAAGREPAHMDFENDIWDWGGWQSVFFIPKPCMLKYDGTVDYYLDPNDYTKRADGITASDIASTSYSGNAMMEWPKIWMKIVPDTDPTSASIYFANYKADENYKCFPYYDTAGNEIDKMYTSIFNGSKIDGKLRSISGQHSEQSKDTTDQIAGATANNTVTDGGWNIELFSDRLMINLLTVLITKSLDCKSKIGQGINTGSQIAVNNYYTGSLNNKGLFYGKSSNAETACKVFGMENYYAFQWRRTLGLIDVNSEKFVKLCYGTKDGSNTSSYNQNGNDYIDTGVGAIFSSSTGGWLKFMEFGSLGWAVPKTDSASQTTYYASYTYENPNATTLALFGGASNGGTRVSLFYCYLSFAASNTDWGVGASLSMKPLAG